MEKTNVFRLVYGLVLVILIYLMAVSCNQEVETPQPIKNREVQLLEKRIKELEDEVSERDSLIYELADPGEGPSNDESDFETYFYE
jgi:hypothetical protein